MQPGQRVHDRLGAVFEPDGTHEPYRAQRAVIPVYGVSAGRKWLDNIFRIQHIDHRAAMGVVEQLPVNKILIDTQLSRMVTSDGMVKISCHRPVTSGVRHAVPYI